MVIVFVKNAGIPQRLERFFAGKTFFQPSYSYIFQIPDVLFSHCNKIYLVNILFMYEEASNNFGKTTSFLGRKNPLMQLGLRIQIWIWLFSRMPAPVKTGPPSVNTPRGESNTLLWEKPSFTVSSRTLRNILPCIYSITAQSNSRKILSSCFSSCYPLFSTNFSATVT